MPGSIIKGIWQRMFPKQKLIKENTSLLLTDITPIVPTILMPEQSLSPNHQNELGNPNFQNNEEVWDFSIKEYEEPSNVVGGIFS